VKKRWKAVSSTSVLSLVRLQHLSPGTKECTLMDWRHLALQKTSPSWWHGGFGSIEMVAFFRDLSPVLILSYRILETRPSCGVWRQPRGSVAYGHDCFVGLWLLLSLFSVFFCYNGHALLRGCLSHLDSLFFYLI
jgi:hypothetical protein